MRATSNDVHALPGGDGGPLGAAVDTLRRHAWLRTRGRRFIRSVAPRGDGPDDREVRIVGLDPIRVLMVGGHYAAGIGASTRDEAIDGPLARMLHEHTGRGVIVVNRADERLRLREQPAALGPNGAHTFHLVVWAPPFHEAARYFRTRVWRDEVSRTIRRVRETSNAGVVVLGIPGLLGRQPIALIARARAAHIDKALRSAAERDPRSVFVESPALQLADVRDADSSTVYGAAARRILPAALHVLPSRPRGRHSWGSISPGVRTTSPS